MNKTSTVILNTKNT